MRTIEHTLEYSDVAQTYLKLTAGENPLPSQRIAVRTLRQIWAEGGWVGATITEMTERINKGWEVPGMRINAGAPAQNRLKWSRNDEDGELDVEAALAGEDLIYVKRTPRKRNPGLVLNIDYAARANVNVNVLAQYGAWIAELVAGLQTRGADLQISIFSSASWSGVTVKSNVRVKRFGRKSSLKSWGAVFSPAGYRTLGFTARAMACAAHGVALSETYGASTSKGYGVEFDPKTRTLTISCDPQARSFPRERMAAQLAALKL